MIISRTPYRISFFGGGTDHPYWFKENGGAVITTTIDKYCYLNVRYLPPFFEHKHRIIYTNIENVKTIDEIKHPSVKAVLKTLGVEHGLEIHHDGDLPARSGLGSSSAFTVGLILAIKALRSEYISKEELAKLAIDIEQNVIRETVGSQDQVAAAHGGFNRVEFKHDGAFSVSPMIIPTENKTTFESSLMLFYTGISRTASDVEKVKLANFAAKNSELKQIQALVGEADRLFHESKNVVEDIGSLLNESWKLKRSLSNTVSNPKIDEIYEMAIKAGAKGGKILGAGSGGFIVFVVPSEAKESVRKKLSSLLHVAFQFESTGSKIVLYDPQIATR